MKTPLTRVPALQSKFEDARRNHLRDGIALSTAAKVAFFEERVTFAMHFGARDRLAVQPSDAMTSSTSASDL